MAPRTLKETYARKRSSDFVENMILIHGDEIAETLTETLAAELGEGEEMPDVSLYFRLMGRRMGRFRTDLVRTSRNHLDVLAGIDKFRDLREEAMRELSQAYVTARQTVATGYSPEDAAAFGFESNVATVPAQMELQIDRLLVNIQKPEVRLSEPLYPAVTFDPAEAEATFRPPLDKLISARIGFDEARGRAEGTLLTKNEAVVANDLKFGQISRCVESHFTLAGYGELAKRVRPSNRRPGRRQEVENDLSPETDPSEEPVPDLPATAGDGGTAVSEPTNAAPAAPTEEDPDGE